MANATQRPGQNMGFTASTYQTPSPRRNTVSVRSHLSCCNNDGAHFGRAQKARCVSEWSTGNGASRIRAVGGKSSDSILKSTDNLPTKYRNLPIWNSKRALMSYNKTLPRVDRDANSRTT